MWVNGCLVNTILHYVCVNDVRNNINFNTIESFVKMSLPEINLFLITHIPVIDKSLFLSYTCQIQIHIY